MRRTIVGLTLGTFALSAVLTSGVAAMSASSRVPATAEAVAQSLTSDIVWRAPLTKGSLSGHAVMSSTPSWSHTSVSFIVDGVKDGDTVHVAIGTKRLGTPTTIFGVVETVATTSGHVDIGLHLGASVRATLEADLADGGTVWARVIDGSTRAEGLFTLV